MGRRWRRGYVNLGKGIVIMMKIVLLVVNASRSRLLLTMGVVFAAEQWAYYLNIKPRCNDARFPQTAKDCKSNSVLLPGSRVHHRTSSYKVTSTVFRLCRTCFRTNIELTLLAVLVSVWQALGYAPCAEVPIQSESRGFSEGTLE